MKFLGLIGTFPFVRSTDETCLLQAAAKLSGETSEELGLVETSNGHKGGWGEGEYDRWGDDDYGEEDEWDDDRGEQTADAPAWGWGLMEINEGGDSSAGSVLDAAVTALADADTVFEHEGAVLHFAPAGSQKCVGKRRNCFRFVKQTRPALLQNDEDGESSAGSVLDAAVTTLADVDTVFEHEGAVLHFAPAGSQKCKGKRRNCYRLIKQTKPALLQNDEDGESSAGSVLDAAVTVLAAVLADADIVLEHEDTVLHFAPAGSQKCYGDRKNCFRLVKQTKPALLQNDEVEDGGSSAGSVLDAAVTVLADADTMLEHEGAELHFAPAGSQKCFGNRRNCYRLVKQTKR